MSQFLCFTALEELVKAHLLHREVIHGQVSEWRAFWRKLRNHRGKIQCLAVGDMFAGDGKAELAELGVSEEDLLATYRASRESSLYVDAWHEGGQIFWLHPANPNRAESVADLLTRVAAVREWLGRKMADHVGYG